MIGMLKSRKIYLLMISLVLIGLMLFTSFLIPKEVQGAVKVDDNAYLQSFGNLLDLVGMKDLVREDGKHLVKEIFKVYYNDGDAWYPAFCIEPDKSGVGTGAGDGYNIKVTDFDNPAIWRAIYWGYMKDYNPSTKTSNWAAWGCRNDDDLYQAVKCVVHAIVENKKYDDAYCVVDIVTSETQDMDWNEVQARSKEIINAGRKIYKKAMETNDTYKIAQIVLKKQSTQIAGDYSVITYQVTDENNHQIDSYNVLISGFPEGATESHNGTTIKIKVPLNANKQNYTGTVIVKDVKVKTYPLYAGVPVENSSWQSYAILTDPFQYLSKDITTNLITEDLKIYKKDSTNQKPLQGAIFDIYKDNNLNGKIDSGEPKVKTGITTGEDGTATITDLEQGAYLIKETKAPDGYRLSDVIGSTRLYALDTAKTEEVTFYNAPKLGKISINKTDSVTNAKLKGAEFDIYLDVNKNNKIDSEDEKVDHLVTNENGEATSKDLLVYNKTYILKETKAPYNYNISTETINDITLIDNTTKNINVKNDCQEGNLTIYKVDKDNHKITLGNVEFDLYSEEFQKVIGTYKTDVNGEINIKKLRIGNYKIIEKSTGKWYNLADDTEVKIEWNKTTETTVENELKKGQVKVIKVDLDNKEVKLKDVEFQVIDKKGNILETLVTNENGEALTKQYAIRDYENLTIKETKTGKWYKLNDKPQTVTLKQDEITTLTFTNELKKGQIKVIKVDLDNKEVKIPDVEFKVYDKKGNVVETLKTDKNGEAISKRLTIDQTYIVQETKTGKWYKLDDKPQTVTLKQDEITTLIFENELKKGQVKIIKIDKEKQEVRLKGVKFNVYVDRNENGKADEDEYLETLVTNEDGEAVTRSYSIRDYEKLILIETETNKEYQLNNNPIKVVLEENQVKTIKFENTPIKTKVNPHKKDRDTGKPLAGAEFDIYKDTNENGKLDEDDKVVYHTVTKEDGYSEDIELYYGTYFVKETKAPEGYTLDHVISTFKVVSQNQKIEINFADKVIENDINIIKKANNNSIKYGIKKNEGVPDSYFVLYKIDEKGNIIDFAKDKFDKYIGEKIVIDGKEYYTVKTDETGNVQVTVPYGKYLFKEIKTHDLFLNDSKDNIIDVLDDGKQVSLEFYNTAVNLELDISKTGINQAQPNDIIRYDFPNLINKSNVSLDDFTWWDHLPSKYTKITKLYTGVWNEELTFKVYYKTNKNDYKQYGLEYSSLVNNCIDFEVLGLDNENDEYITDFKVEFGTVKSGFTFIEAPFIFTRVDSDIKKDDEWTNKTKLTGQYTDINGNIVELEDNDEHTTKTYAEELKITKLPRTGNDIDKVSIIFSIIAIISILTYVIVIKFVK